MISIDSAVWYIEAALNYTYCMHTEDDPIIDELIIDTIKFNFNTSQGIIPIHEVANIYNAMADHTATEFEKIENSDKDIIFQDAFADENKLTIITVYGIKIVPDAFRPFEEEWKFGLEMGKCDGTNIGSDAAIEITKKANFRIPRIYGYYTNHTTIFIESEEYDNPNSDDPNFCDHYLFDEGGDYDPNGTYSWCLTVEEMNFYLNSIPIVANFVKIDHDLSLYDFISVSLLADGIPDNHQYTPIFHDGNFTFAIPHSYVPNPK